MASTIVASIARAFRVVGTEPVASGDADDAIHHSLALLNLSAAHLLTTLEATLRAELQRTGVNVDDDDDRTLRLLVLIRAVGRIAPAAIDHTEYAIDNLCLPLLLHATKAYTIPAVVYETACECIANLLKSINGRGAAFLEELQSKVVAAIAHTETHAEVKDRLGVQQAAALFIHLQKVSPSYAFQSAVVAASVRLSISRHVHIRAASLRVLGSLLDTPADAAAAHSLSADDRLNLAGEVWRGLATGCVLDDASIRSHCYKTACALQPCLLPAWQACLHRRAEDPALPNAPYGLLLHALREHGADRLNALEVKAAAFICRSALEAHSDVGERVPGGGGGTSHVYPSIGALQLLDQYLELYSALDSFHVYLIEPVWPQSPEWWLGCPSGEGACSPPAWPWLEVLLRKAFDHTNVAVRYWVATTLLQKIGAGGAPLPPASFVVGHLLPLLLHKSATFRVSPATPPHAGGEAWTRQEETGAHDARPASVSPLSQAVGAGVAAYVRGTMEANGVKAVSALVEDLLRGCLAAPKLYACEALLGAIADAVDGPRYLAVLTVDGFRLLRDFLFQATRSYERVALGRVWQCGVRLLLSMGDPMLMGLLPIVSLLKEAPESLRLLGDPPNSEIARWLAQAGTVPSHTVSSTPASAAAATSTDAQHPDSSWGAEQMSRAVVSYLAHDSDASAMTASLEAATYTASDVAAIVDRATTIALASATVEPMARVTSVVEVLCSQLASVHTRAYLHPLQAPRLLILLRAMLSDAGGGLAWTDDARAQEATVRTLSVCVEGCCGYVDLSLSQVELAVGDRGCSPDHLEWMCERATVATATVAAIAASMPRVPAYATFVGQRILPTLARMLSRANGGAARLMASRSLQGVAEALAASSATITAIPPSLRSAAVNAATCSLEEAHDRSNEEQAGADVGVDVGAEAGASAGAGGGQEAYACEVARWAALDSLLLVVESPREPPEATAAASAAHDELGRSQIARLPTLQRLRAFFGECAGDADALRCLLSCASRLVPYWAVAEGGQGELAALYGAALDALREVRNTALQPALCVPAARLLLGDAALSSAAAVERCHAAFDFFTGLGATRPFAARLAAAPLCAWLRASPPLAHRWLTRLHALLLFGEAPPGGSTVISTLDDIDLDASTSPAVRFFWERFPFLPLPFPLGR